MYDEKSGSLSELTFQPSEMGADATGISDSGIISGWEDAPLPSFAVYAGFWTVAGGAMLLTQQTEQPPPGYYAVAVNDGGDIVGYRDDAEGRAPILWSAPDHSMTFLPDPTCTQCGQRIVSVNAINDSGTAVGVGNVDMPSSPTGMGTVALEWQDGAVTSLGTLDGSYNSGADGINSKGDVVGSAQIGPDRTSPTHAFLYHAGTMTDLGTLPGDTGSGASSINDRGEIVGYSDSGAFLYVNGLMCNLSSLVDPNDPLAALVKFDGAVSVSSNGLIAVNGKDARTPTLQQAFLLVPSN